jgi:succinate-acetate transporter protein
MSKEDQAMTAKIRDTTANPAPLGLLGFGMTTVLLNIHNAGYSGLGSAILSMGVFFGGFAQIFAGWMEWKKGNTFGTVAFTSYGLFWLTFVGLVVWPGVGSAGVEATSNGLLGWYLFLWGLFTLAMFVGTLRISRSLQVVFGTLLVLFWLLAAAKWSGSGVVGRIAGWEGIVCGLSAIYGASAQVLNEVYGKVVLPLGPVSR